MEKSLILYLLFENRFPAFGLFKNEQFIKYEGEVSEETAVLTWALSPETLDLPGYKLFSYLPEIILEILIR